MPFSETPPTMPIQGVFRVPVKSVHFDIQEQVNAALKGIEPGKTMAVLNIATGSGVNIAVSHKFDDHWKTVMWIGKSGWQTPIEGGVSVAFSR